MVSLSASAQVTIDRDPSEVWAYVSDVTNQDQWVDGMSDSEVIGDGPIGRGTQIRGTYTYGSGSAPTQLTITEFREGRQISIESSDGPFPFAGVLTLQRTGSSTLVTNSMTAGSDHIMTSVMFTVFRPLTKMMMTRQLRKELGQLRAILESGEQPVTAPARR